MHAAGVVARMAYVGLVVGVVGLALGHAREAHAADVSAESAAPVVQPCAGPARLTRRTGSCDPCCAPCPRLHVTVGAWVWGLDGTLGGTGREADIDSSWTDTLEAIDKLEFAFNARVRYEWGRWAASLEVNGADVGDTATFRRLGAEIEADASVWTLQGQLGYRFHGTTLGCGPCAPTVCYEAYVGARAWWTDVSLEPGGTAAPLPTLGSSHDWVDPLVGLRAEITWPSRWFVIAEADVGGFGIGSDFSWHLLASVGRRFSDHCALSAGWKILDVDYQSSSYTFDVQMSGPFLALTLSF